MKTAQQMFEDLGFKRNMSECYNDTHVLYEQSILNGNEIFCVEFKDNHFVYRNLTMRALCTYGDLLNAISKQMQELHWIDADEPLQVENTEFEQNCNNCFYENCTSNEYPCNVCTQNYVLKYKPACSDCKTCKNENRNYCYSCGKKLKESV